MREEGQGGVLSDAEPFSAVQQSCLKYGALLKDLHDICLVKMLTETADYTEPSLTTEDMNQARLLETSVAVSRDEVQTPKKFNHSPLSKDKKEQI